MSTSFLQKQWTSSIVNKPSDQDAESLIVKLYLLDLSSKNSNYTQDINMWPHQAEWVVCHLWSKMGFRYGCKENTQSFQNLKTPCQCDFSLHSYVKLYTWQNNKIQKGLHTIIGCLSRNQYSRHLTHSVWLGHILLCFQLDYMNNKVTLGWCDDCSPVNITKVQHVNFSYTDTL